MDVDEHGLVASPAIVVDEVVGMAGYIPGLCQPALRATITVQSRSTYASRVTQALITALPSVAPPRMEGDIDDGLVHVLLHWIVEIQRAADLPIFGSGRVLRSTGSAVPRYTVALPVMDEAHMEASRALTWLVSFINAVCAGRAVEADVSALHKVLGDLRRRRPPSYEAAQFIAAAEALGLPVTHLPGGIFQFGQGVRARLLRNSLTDETPFIGASVARDKQLTTRVLRRAGVPMPIHAVAKDVAEAERIADRLGYPVVVKPVDLDGGIGVSAGIRNRDELRAAYDSARMRSRRILVEKHFEGRDYRLLVFHDRVVRVVERVPAGVSGDGVRTVQALVDEANRDPRRGSGPNDLLKPLVLDAEAEGLLAASGMTVASIPEVGTFVRLRRASNINLGGLPQLVTGAVHPDNVLLARRIAAILRLDLAGIDLLIPDIAQSWLESGAVVCEVNAEPNLGRLTAGSLYQDILRELVPDDGRVPTAVAIAADAGLSVAIVAALRASGVVAGRTARDGTWIGSDCIARNTPSAFIGGRMLMIDPAVEAALISVPGVSFLKAGLPFDRFDVLIVAGATESADGGGAPLCGPTAKDLVRFLLPASRGTILISADCPDAAEIADSVPKDRQVRVIPVSELAATASVLMRARGGDVSLP